MKKLLIFSVFVFVFASFTLLFGQSNGWYLEKNMGGFVLDTTKSAVSTGINSSGSIVGIFSSYGKTIYFLNGKYVVAQFRKNKPGSVSDYITTTMKIRGGESNLYAVVPHFGFVNIKRGVSGSVVGVNEHMSVAMYADGQTYHYRFDFQPLSNNDKAWNDMILMMFAVYPKNFTDPTVVYTGADIEVGDMIAYTNGVSKIFNTFNVNPPTKPVLVLPTLDQKNVPKNALFRWNKSENGDKYILLISKDNLFTSPLRDSVLIDTTKSIPISEGQRYYWKVQAKNFAGVSPWSDVWDFTTALSKPTNLILQRTALKEITLTWSDNSNGEDGYVIDRKLGTETYATIDTLKGPSGNKYIDKKVEQGPTYWYRIKAYTKFSVSDFSNEASILVVGVKDDVIPTEFALSQNYPNPFNPSTVISYQLKEKSFVTLKVFDVLGREIAVLVNGEKPAGMYEVNFDASRLSSGIYIYKIQAGNFAATKKMILAK